MKLITAIIRPEKLNAALEALIAAARTGEVDVAAVTPALAVAG